VIIESGYPLQAHNSFGFDVEARFFTSAGSEQDVIEALEWAESHGQPIFPLGGGSNTVMVDAPTGLVLHVNIEGIEDHTEGEDGVLLRVGAGEDWTRLVEHTVEQGWFGLENLALIPGNAGSAPVQNIGAYGVELADVMVKLEAIDRETKTLVELSADDCAFAYRSSRFKGADKDRYIITHIWLQLSLKDNPVVEYPALRQALSHPDDCTAREVFDAVVSVRSARLPAPEHLGNAGSFFTNPLVNTELATRLAKEFPELPQWQVNDNIVKLSAGWLVEQCGWKGFRDDEVGVFPHQAIVLINYGKGTGSQIIALANDIIASVEKKYGVTLEIEPNVINNGS